MSKSAVKSRFTFQEYVTLVWFIIDAFTHLTIELGYVYLALTTTANKSDTYLGHIWREYGRADSRWAGRDVTVISIEVATVAMGLLCLFQIYGVAKRSSWRYVLQVVISVAELYGGWMTFAPEWFDGSPNLNGSEFSLLWIYLVFMNGLWVMIPALLVWDGMARISFACNSADKVVPPIQEGFPAGAPSKFWFQAAAGTIVLYMILVPAVLFTAKGVPVNM